MKDCMHIIYAKHFRFPHTPANVIQGLNMLDAFSACSAQVHSFFSIDKNINYKEAFIHAVREFGFESLGDYTVVPKICRGLHYTLWLARHILSSGVQTVIYTRENSPVRQALRFRCLRHPPIPIFHEVHNFDFGLENPSLQDRRKQDELVRILAKINGVIFIDEGLQEQAREHLKLRVPSYVAPSGANISLFAKRRFPPLSSDILLGFFGKINEAKGVMLLARAMQFLPEQYRLRLVGNISEKDKNLLFKAAGAAVHRIELKERVVPALLAEAMQGVHISVIPSVAEEAFLSPLKLAESLAMGLPLVCMPMPHLKRILQEGKHALFAESTTAEALAKSIRVLGDSPVLMESMQRENRVYAEQFSWQKRAQGIMDFMQEVTKTQ
jgi:glycosyltransferase involved in cell wall biosynthesis